MNRENTSSTIFEALKKKAEKIVKTRDINSADFDRQNFAELIYEVEVKNEELRRQNDELRKSLKDLNRAQEVGQLGSWRLDVLRDVLTWSDENYRIFGVPVGADLTYEKFLEIVHPEDRGYVDVHWKACLSGEPYDIEHRIIVAGAVRWVREKAYLEFNEAGEPLGGFGITQDITERKRAEQMLRESENRFRTMANGLPLIVWDHDTDGRQQFVNSIFGEFCGLPVDKLHGDRWVTLLHPEDAAAYTEKFLACVRDRRPFNAQVRLRRVDGEWRWFESWGKPRFSPSGDYLGFVGTSADITEHRKAEEVLRGYRKELEREVSNRTVEIETQKKELEELNKLIRKLSWKTIDALETERKSLSKEIHDSIAGTLAAIKMQLETHLPPTARDLPSRAMPLEKIVRHLTGAIKETKRISRQLRSTTLDDFGLKPALEEHIRYFKEFFPDIDVVSQIEIEDINIPDDIQTVIYRVLQEALNNVGKHSAAGVVRVRLTAHRGRIVLKVSDNGSGFDLQSVLSESDSLMGYGIHSMRERVEVCDGKFEIYSALDRGTSIYISIPLK